MWAEKDSPLHWTSTHARTHACMRKGGGDGSRQVEGGKSGRQAGKVLSWYPVLGIVQSVYTSNPGRNVR